MSTIIVRDQVEYLQRHADKNVMVRADAEHFRISTNNPFNRLLVWVKTKILPASQTRQITEARERFISSIADRYGADARAAAHEILGTNSKKPLTSRVIRQVFDALPQPGPTLPRSAHTQAGQPSGPAPPPPAPAQAGQPGSPAQAPLPPPDTAATHRPTPPETARASLREPEPPRGANAAAPNFLMQVDAGAEQRRVNPPSPDPLPAGAPFYRELQDGGTGLCGMHALNAFCGGPVVGGDEYRRTCIETALNQMQLQGTERAATRALLEEGEFSSDPAVTGAMLAQLARDGRVDQACTRAAVETGVNIRNAGASAQARARLNAFPGDRLLIGYSKGDSGAAHMVALRREQDGNWQVLDSLKSSKEPPARFATLTDCLDTLPDGLTIVHLEEGFSFKAPAAAAGAPIQQPQGSPQHGGAAIPDSPPPPLSHGSGLTAMAGTASGSIQDDLDNLPPPAFGEADLEAMAAADQAAADDGLDNLPPPAFDEHDLATMAQHEPYIREGIAREYVAPLLAAGINPAQAVALFRGIAREGDDPREVFSSGIPLDQLKDLYEHGLGLTEARTLQDANLPLSFIQSVYTPYQIPITRDCMVRYTDQDAKGPPKLFGTGGFNSVYTVEHTDGKRRIFKPLSAIKPNQQQQVEFGWVAMQTGVNPYNPQTAARNISTCRLADRLGFDVVVPTQLGLHTMLSAPPGTPPTLGLVMEAAPGRAANAYPPYTDLFDDPEVRRETTKLQLLDCLTAQGDRHGGNYFINVRPDGRVQVAGIDNDQCLGSRVVDPDTMRRGPRTDPNRCGYRGCGLPPVIDTEMAHALEHLTAPQVRDLLADKLQPAEVDATIARLGAIKQHIAKLRQEGKIIDPANWGRGLVSAETNHTNSYFAREAAMNVGITVFGDAARALDALGY